MLLATYYKCGDVIPKMAAIIPQLTSTIVDLLKIAIPIILIILGMLDFGKAVMAQKEDEIKKSQGLFVKRLLSAALVFFVFIIVEVVFNLVTSDDPDQENIWNCVNCFINNECGDPVA